MVITVFAPEDYKSNARGSCIFSLQKLDKGSRVVMIALKLGWPVLVKDLKATIHGVHSDGPNIFPSSSIVTFLRHQLHLVLRRGLGGKLGQKLRSSLQLDPEVPGKRCFFLNFARVFVGNVWMV